MKRVVAVDLGKRVAGIAVFDEDGRLVYATELGSRPDQMAAHLFRTGDSLAPRARWVAERMLDYLGKGARTKDLDALRDLSRDLAALVREGKGSYRDLPAARWKGSVPKEVSHARILKFLDDDERAAIVIESKESLDAIGIGLYVTGRAGRGMVRPRRPR